MQVEFPIFHNQPRLPAPFGVFAYPQFPILPLVDRLTSIPVIAAGMGVQLFNLCYKSAHFLTSICCLCPVIDFDNTDTAWRKYDAMTARELFKMYGCSQRLYKEVFEPAIQTALFAPEFANLLRLSTIDVISVRLWFDKKITIPNVANVCSGFDDSSGLTFFDLTSVYDDYYGEPITVVEAQFEKAYVTGLEAANRVVDYFGNGDFAKIIAVEGDEPHIETLRSLNRRANELKSQIPFSEFFLQ
ncbi:hypothetical protein PR202_gb14709 [Eleusine coracana subsp. coracana]|uniref:Uncharacterized protein n=1 Tax=Eleusine coracana subsp. coracana TaxID=191504 RepID=A0AAV5EW09_ELECO|nr:hypothetical protein PR202_gb14709 [Eleusine coracana subsp. coracana]